MAITAQNIKLKPGYKQTEVGMIPEDWDVKNLGNLGRVIRGASPRPQGDKRYYGGNIPRLMVEDVTRDGKYVTPRVDFLTEEGAKRSRPCKKGTLTIVCSGTVGIPSFLTVDACIHDGFLALIDINKYVSEDYLYHQLMILKGKFEISATHGGVFTNLTTSILTDFQIPLPSLPEQRAIATALSDIDALITSLDRLIAKKRDIKQATMQQLLTSKTRLPGFSGEWEMKKLGDVVKTILGGGTPSRSKPEYWGGNISWVTVKDFATFDPHSTQESITEAGLQNSSSNLIKKGTIITSTRMAIGKAVIYEVEVSINQDLKAIFLKKDINALFIFYWFEQNAKIIENLGSGSTVKGVSLSDLRNVSFLKPSTITEQKAIATILSDMDAEIASLEQKRDNTRALKQGMMQELLTGKTRLI